MHDDGNAQAVRGKNDRHGNVAAFGEKDIRFAFAQYFFGFKIAAENAEGITEIFQAEIAAQFARTDAVIRKAGLSDDLLFDARFGADIFHLSLIHILGALSINIALDEIMDWLLEQFDVVHIRGTGKLNAELNKRSGYVQYEYVSEGLEDIFAASDLMISRAGSNAIFELLALRLPNLLIPLPLEASRGDQILNARYFEKMGYSDVLMQNDITPEVLKAHITALCEHAPAMRAAMEQSPMAAVSYTHLWKARWSCKIPAVPYKRPIPGNR